MIENMVLLFVSQMIVALNSDAGNVVVVEYGKSKNLVNEFSYFE
jgi:hypothetical protein